MVDKSVSIVSESSLREQLAALSKHRNMHFTDTSPNTLEGVKSPLIKRIEKSKFNKIIESMSDEDLKLTAYAICLNDDVKEAVKCFHSSVTNYVQIAALAKELNERNIKIYT